MCEGLMVDQAQCRCPTCGAPYTADRPRVDLDRNLFISASGWVKLRRTEAEIAAIIAQAYPGIARHDAIVLGVYGAGDIPLTENIKVHVSRMRDALQPIGWTVKVVRTRGYRFDRIAGEHQ